MRNIIIEHDYANADWAGLIDEVYREISSMTAAEVMVAFIERSRKLLLKEDAFIAVVSSGKFYLEMARGELNWEFIFPDKKPAVSDNFHSITISWKEVIKRTEIEKEITIPYGDCGFDTFIGILQAEMPEWLANHMAAHVLDIIDKKTVDESEINKCQAIEYLENGEFNEKFMECLRFGDSVNKFEIARAIESALVHTLQQYGETTRRLLASGTFIYDTDEGKIVFEVIGEDFKEVNDDFKLRVIIRENDELGLPFASFEVQSTFDV